jgi:hypothetical protein
MPIVSFDFEKGGKGELAEWKKPKSKNKKTQKVVDFLLHKTFSFKRMWTEESRSAYLR